jgi:hypothetical protein
MKRLICLLLALFLSTPACFSETQNYSAHSEVQRQYLRMILTRIVQNWEPAKFASIMRNHLIAYNLAKKVDSGPREYFYPVEVQPKFSFSVDRNGEIGDLSKVSSSGSTIADLACADAILSLSPLSPVPAEIKTPLSLICDFESPVIGIQNSSNIDGVFVSDCQIRKSDKDVPECKQYESDGHIALWSFHAIPVDVLTRYPGVLKEEEIHSGDNLRRLDISKADAQIRTLRAEWANFFRDHPKVTAQQIYAQQEKLDKMFDWLNGGLLNSARKVSRGEGHQ